MTSDSLRAPALLLATLLGVAVSVRLGLWQLHRAAQKIELQQAMERRATLPMLRSDELARTNTEAASQLYRRVALRGRWIAAATVFLENRQLNGVPGFYVVTPLRLAGSNDAVLVQRGWAPRDPVRRAHLPVIAQDAGEVSVVGHIAPPPARLYEFSKAASGPIRQNLDVDDYAHEIGVPLVPVSVVQEVGPTPDDGLSRQWPRPATGVQTHDGYAFQWFALGALMAGLYVWFQLVRPRLASRA